MPPFLHAAALALVSVTLLACSGRLPSNAADPVGTNGASAQTPLQETPRQMTFTPTRGQAFSVVLPSAGGGGYAWHLVQDYDTRVVTLRNQHTGTVSPNAPLGKFADEIFEFEAAASGRTTLTFSQYREWEGPSRAAETRQYPVVVQ